MYKTSQLICLIIMVFFLLGGEVCYSQVDSLHVATDSTAQRDEMDIGSEYSINFGKVALRAFFSLVLITVLIFVSIFLVKKFIFSNKNKRLFNNTVSVLGMVPLAPRKSIYLVKILDRILVVGLSEDNINLLTQIKDGEQVRLLETGLQLNTSQAVPFKNLLDKMLGKSNDK